MGATQKAENRAATQFNLGNLAPEESDVIFLMVGGSFDSTRRRTPAESAAITERLLACWQILPALPDNLIEGPVRKALVPEYYRRLVHGRLAVTAFQKAQIVGCRPLLHALERSGLSYSLLKGAAAACVLYDQRYMRAAWDFDIGVSWRDLPAAETLALEAGFHQAQRDAETNRFYRSSRRLRAIVEKDHYELGYLIRRLEVTNLSAETLEAIRTEKWAQQFWHDVNSDTPWCYAAADIHHAISLEIGLDDLLAKTRRITVDDGPVRVPDDAWLTVHLIYKTYWEGVHNYGKGLYQYSDLVRLLRTLKGDSFARAVTILESYNLIAAGYHTLKNLYRFDNPVPDFVASFIADAKCPPAGSDPIGVNDLGDPWPKLWGRR